MNFSTIFYVMCGIMVVVAILLAIMGYKQFQRDLKNFEDFNSQLSGALDQYVLDLEEQPKSEKPRHLTIVK